MTNDRAPDAPLLRVVQGEPSAEELAALTAVLVARAAAAVPRQDGEPASAWALRRAALRRPLHPGAGEWRRSGFPRGAHTGG